MHGKALTMTKISHIDRLPTAENHKIIYRKKFLDQYNAVTSSQYVGPSVLFISSGHQ